MNNETWFEGKTIDHVDNWGDEVYIYFTDGSRARMVVCCSSIRIEHTPVEPHCDTTNQIMAFEFFGG